MQPKVRTSVAYANFLLGAGIGAWSLYLISMPLHPAAGDSHGGLLAVFSGFFLAPVALTAFATGRLFQRHSRGAWPMQVLALALVAALVLRLAL
ncbi:hypothetical protein [Lysobacter olei]